MIGHPIPAQHIRTSGHVISPAHFFKKGASATYPKLNLYRLSALRRLSMKRTIPVLTAVAILLLGGYLYVSPYITLLMLRNAIDTKSVNDLERLIDFSDVRDSLRSQLIAYLQEQASKTGNDSSLAQFTAGIGSAIGGSFIDTVVQPSNLDKWLDGERLSGVSENANIGSLPSVLEGSILPSMRYQSFDAFQVSFEGSDLVESITLERRNFITWKVSVVGINMAALNTATAEPASNEKSAIITDNANGKNGLGCQVLVESVHKELKDRLRSDRNEFMRNGPKSSNLYFNLYWTGERMESNSEANRFFNDEAGMRSYATKVLKACQDVDTVSFNEHSLDGRLITFEMTTANYVRRCGVHSHDQKPYCGVTLD